MDGCRDQVTGGTETPSRLSTNPSSSESACRGSVSFASFVPSRSRFPPPLSPSASVSASRGSVSRRSKYPLGFCLQRRLRYRHRRCLVSWDQCPYLPRCHRCHRCQNQVSEGPFHWSVQCRRHCGLPDHPLTITVRIDVQWIGGRRNLDAVGNAVRIRVRLSRRCFSNVDASISIEVFRAVGESITIAIDQSGCGSTGHAVHSH